MSKAEILDELSRLTHQERREVLRRLMELEDEAELLADSDRLADERFLMLDELEREAENGHIPAG